MFTGQHNSQDILEESGHDRDSLQRYQTLDQKQCNFDDEFNDTIEMIDSPLSSTRLNNMNGNMRSPKDKTLENKTSPISIDHSQGPMSEKNSRDDSGDELKSIKQTFALKLQLSAADANQAELPAGANQQRGMTKRISLSAQVSAKKEKSPMSPGEYQEVVNHQTQENVGTKGNDDSGEQDMRIQSDFDSDDEEIINMKPIDFAVNILQQPCHSNSSPSKYSKISLSKMSSTSLIYKKKMDRLMHSIKVHNVCGDDCDCNKRYG